ncbi:MAG: hypothetical protein ACR2QL_09195, partial [Woeseiaceae bacterium]
MIRIPLKMAAARFQAAAVLVAMLAWSEAGADLLDTAEESADEGQDYMEVALTGIYQSAVQAGEDTGNFEVDIMGAMTLLDRDSNQTFGRGSLVYWVFSVDNFGDMQSTGDFASKAGLLWPTNDVSVSESFTAFGVFAWQQELWQDRVTLHAGKLFIGNFVTESPYTASNTETFMSRVISNDMAGRYFDTMGLGAQLQYNGDRWFATGGFADATASNEFDFNTFVKGDWTVYGEAGYRLTRSQEGISVVSLLATSAAETSTLKSQQTVTAAFTHEFGGDGSKYALFGRYTFGDGGEGKSAESADSAVPLDNGGFVGFAANQPLGRESHQIGVALMYGEPTDHRRSQGFDDQYGIEAYWKLPVADWLDISFDLQLVNNVESE